MMKESFFTILNSSRPRGFTLIEILAVLGLFALLSVGIASSLNQTTTITRRLQHREATTFSAQIALDRLQRDLQSAFHEKVQNSPSAFRLSDPGALPELEFSYLDTPIRVLFERRAGGLKKVRYRVEKDEGDLLKITRSDLLLDSTASLDESPVQIVAKGVMKFEIEVYDHRQDKWRKTWDSSAGETTNVFPKAVRLLIQTVDPKVLLAERAAKSLIAQTKFLILNEVNGL